MGYFGKMKPTSNLTELGTREHKEKLDLTNFMGYKKVEMENN